VKIAKVIFAALLIVSLGFAGATLQSFAGYADNNRIILQWNTSSEVNVAGFQIQRSTDGRTFFDIGFLHAQGQGSGYTFIDDSIIAKVSGREYYYRLKIRDINGDSQLSDVITIQSNMLNVVQTWGSL
jgi:hypothetical protein